MPEMTPQRYQQLCDLFDQAQQQDPAERAQFVQQACAQDPSLRAELEKLLLHDQQTWRELFADACPVNAKDLLAADTPSALPERNPQPPVRPQGNEVETSKSIPEGPGTRISPYKPLQQL